MATFFKTPGFKYFKNFVFGVGAAVVIIGALGKLTHAEWADTALWVGMVTEAVLFAMSGVIPPDKEYYWEKLYPGLDVADGPVEGGSAPAAKGGKGTAALDKMLDDAKIDQTAINRLGDNLKKLGENVSGLTSIANTTVVTQEFSAKAKEAATALGNIAPEFSKAAQAMTSLSSSTGEMGSFHVQVQNATKNLAALNAVYELELQDTNTHLKAMNKFIGNLGTAMNNLEESMADTNKYKDNMAKLAVNLEKMNNIYGNMLSAMKS
jgi:gliding motility-associated protein GldL